MLDDLKKDATVRMQKCVTAFRDQLKKLRTGRAHTSLIEHIKVDYYGSEMPLNQVANILGGDHGHRPIERLQIGMEHAFIARGEDALRLSLIGAVIRSVKK